MIGRRFNVSKRNKILMFVTMIAIFIAGIYHPRQNLPKLFENTSPAIVWVGTDEWQGTGFLINPNGLIATAGHVANAYDFKIQFSDGRRGTAKYVYLEDMDICDVGFIQITSITRNDFSILEWLKWLSHFCWYDKSLSEPIKNLPYLKFDTKTKIGESIVILGYPWGLNKTISMTSGIVAASQHTWSPYLKLSLFADVASYPGNSGSPVVDMDGEVIGILVSGPYEHESYSMCTPARLVELALNKYLANEAMRKAK
jgi:S1-C subfamily serine protease